MAVVNCSKGKEMMNGSKRCLSHCIQRALLAVWLLGVWGCASLQQRTAYDYQHHQLVIHKDGAAIASPTRQEAFSKPSDKIDTNRILLQVAEVQQHIERTIISGIDAHVRSLSAAPSRECDGRLHLLIIVHGGMNGYDSSSKHVTDLMPSPISAPSDVVGSYQQQGVLNKSCYYPMFINWDSDFPDSIADDLFRYRFGKHNASLATSTFPIVLGNRILASAMSVPTAILHQGQTAWHGISGAYEEGDPWLGIVGDTLLNLPAYGLGMAFLPFAEGIGSPAWGIMKKRVDDATSVRTPAISPGFKGAARTLMEALQARVVVDEACGRIQSRAVDGRRYCWSNSSTEVDITLVGHSMGAMVVNRLLDVMNDTHASASNRSLPITRVVFLAPACSINEAEQLLMPYLERHEQTHFWLFALNKRDESRQIPLNGWAVFLPRGTLLAWIDTFLEQETGPAEGRLGWAKALEDFYGTSSAPQPKRSLVEYFSRATSPFRPLNVLWARANLRDRIHTYLSQRRVLNHGFAPEYHEDFLQPDHFANILCQLDESAFKSSSVCRP
ncbi:MAG: hypothetical protein JNL86_05350 [Nitrospira sp.]|nr:hypothetical protein [Nitrospira sp.]MCC7470091.1 hypothetical protein [Candidatus Nomurabacteria bacterium]